MPLRPWTRRALGALAGLGAAAAGLGVAELVAATAPSMQSPMLDVGDRVVDGVPQWVKARAIAWFGTHDKAALLIGIAVILTAYAAFAGALAFGRHLWMGVAGAVGLGAVGVVASQSTRRAAPWTAALPSVSAAVVAGATLIALRAAATRRSPEHAPPTVRSIAEMVPNERRRFLVALAGTAVAAAAVGTTGRRARARFDVGAQRAGLVLPSPAEPLRSMAEASSAGVPGAAAFFTPNRDFYRIDTALTVPQVSVDGWTLSVTGLVDRPLQFSYEELLDRPLVEADITLTCVSNEVGGHLLGTARWLGVRLDDLLAEAGIGADADQVVGRSVDGYTCGFPVSALDGRDALVVVGMNGEPLPLAHGYPARLVVPGLYGYVSATKWLREIELTRFDRFDQYWVRRGWDDHAPIKVQSRIDTPRGLATLAAGPVMIAGVAWAQTRGIDGIEVRVDDGDWVPATLAEEWNDVTWRQWSLPWNAVPGRHSITVRAIERGGAIQTAERSEPFPSGATGQHQIVVVVR